MSKVAIYLNFPKQTEEAFHFYKNVFKSDFVGAGFSRFKDMPGNPQLDQMSEADRNLIMHVELPIMNGALSLMGTDAPESMGFNTVIGNNVHISLSPDSKNDADELFAALSNGGKVTMPLQDTFWGAYYGSCTDKFGIQWMLNVQS